MSYIPGYLGRRDACQIVGEQFYNARGKGYIKNTSYPEHGVIRIIAAPSSRLVAKIEASKHLMRTPLPVPLGESISR